MSRVRGSGKRLHSPIDQVALEAPAGRARRLVRLQITAIVLITMAAGLLGILAVSLPPEDCAWPLLGLAVVAMLGGLFVGMTDYLHGSSVKALVATASALRQSAAERAADLARANAALRRRDDERATLFATMSHELRTPLNAIIGSSHALLDNLDGELMPEQRDDVVQIHEGGKGLLTIVNSTLDLARLDAGAMTLHRTPVQVWAIVEEVAAVLRVAAATRGLTIAREIPADLPAVDADEDRLRQVLVNVVGNAVKFTYAGTICIRARVADDRVIVCVSDTGIGIDRESQDVIFEPFRQVENGTDRNAGGTGLGLAISRRLVELMGGSIWVESERGVGSTFSIALPVVEQANPGPLAASRPAAADVVVVAPPERAGQLVAALTRREITVRCIYGADWLRELGAARPRLVLFDILQPHAEGWRGLAVLRASADHGGLPVGLIGLGFGSGRLVLPSDLDVLIDTDAELTQAADVMMRQGEIDRGREAGRVLILGADVTWRRRIGAIFVSAGALATEASTVGEARTLAGRVPVRAVVLDVRVAEPGIADLLSAAEDDDTWRHLPTLVVVPRLLTPRQQRDLHLASAAWSRTEATPMDKLAETIVEQVACSPRWPAIVGGRP